MCFKINKRLPEPSLGGEWVESACLFLSKECKIWDGEPKQFKSVMLTLPVK